MKGKPNLRHFKFNQNVVIPININIFGELKFCLQSSKLRTSYGVHTLSALRSKCDKRNIINFIQYFVSVTVNVIATTTSVVGVVVMTEKNW